MSQEQYGVNWPDVFMAFGTVALVFAVTVGGFYAWNTVFKTLWTTEANLKESLKSQGVYKNEDGVWIIKTDKTMDQETYKDKTQAGMIKAMGATSFSGSPGSPIPSGKKDKKKLEKKAE